MTHQTTPIDAIRHSLAHILAMAVLKIRPDAKLAIGPAIEHGCYYDFDLSEPISEKDFPKLEKIMRKMIAQKMRFSGIEVTREQAEEYFKDQPYKLELIKEFAEEGQKLTIYATCPPSVDFQLSTRNCFADLCRGGHVETTGEINPDAFTIMNTAGAYWRGSEKNPMLTRIYVAVFATKEELDAHLHMLEEAKRRDHRKLGKELGLYTIVDEVGPGLPLFYPKGEFLRRTIENTIMKLQEKRGYEAIWIPHVTKEDLYRISGHLDKYDAMYPPMELAEEARYYLKPMNCPHFMMLYKSEPRSYRDLPLRWVSTTTVYRYEKSGELSGLTRVRALTQDDCHVFAAPEDIEKEIDLMLDMVEEVYGIFGFTDFRVRVSTRDEEDKEKYIGDPSVWQQSEDALLALMKKRGWEYELGAGEAAFYGPKLDFMFKDALGREWQLSTIQLDMNLAERFGLEYTAADGSKKTPIVIHRAILGSTERFLGILIEHYAGAFPLWLAPVQVRVISVGADFRAYAEKVLAQLRDAGIRADIAPEDITVGKAIRMGETEKIPYLLVVGEREMSADTVAVRERGKGDIGAMDIKKFITLVTTPQ